MNRQTRSPLPTPSSIRALATLFVRRSNSPQVRLSSPQATHTRPAKLRPCWAMTSAKERSGRSSGRVIGGRAAGRDALLRGADHRRGACANRGEDLLVILGRRLFVEHKDDACLVLREDLGTR